jgi:hypothetical protein
VAQLFPDVRDIGTLGAQPSIPYALPISVEGQGASDGAASVGTVYEVDIPSQADELFGANSSLSSLIKFLLGRGVSPVWGVASIMGSGTPNLTQRQEAWAVLESSPLIRIRLTDDDALSTLEALADSCTNANLIYNKQVGFGGLASGSTKAQILSAAAAINNNRFVLTGPGIILADGTLQSGAYAAAAVAAAVGTNDNLADSLSLDVLFNIAGIEEDTNGLPIFIKRVVAGSVVNDFEDLLQSGASPLMSDESGAGVRITHLRTTYVGTNPNAPDTSFDALMTRIILDQAFVAVKNYCYQNNWFRRGNTQANRDTLAAGVTSVLTSQFTGAILPVPQADGSVGYGVTVVPSGDMRQVTIHYEGQVVRDINVINIDEELTIPV